MSSQQQQAADNDVAAEVSDCVVCGSNDAGFAFRLDDCEHVCCLGCLRRWSVFGAKVIPDDTTGARLSTKDPTCPACRKPYHFQICFAEQKVQTGVLLWPRTKSLLARTATCPKCKKTCKSTAIDKIRCPSCRKHFTLEREFTLACPECQQQVAINSLVAHAMQCIKVPCPACEQPFADFGAHVRTECTKVPVMCCGATGTFAEMQAHKRAGILACGLGAFM
jgi:hypothetical protein